MLVMAIRHSIKQTQIFSNEHTGTCLALQCLIIKKGVVNHCKLNISIAMELRTKHAHLYNF